MGAGKTERAMRWSDEGLLAAQADAEIEVPVWLDARDVTACLHAAVRTALGHDPRGACRIVVDNLDGVSVGRARQLLDQARELVTAWPALGVLATCRPGVSAHSDELVTVESWPRERGLELVRIVTGDSAWRIWTTETLAVLTSPLTALAVAARLHAGKDVPISRTTLLSDLARTIVEGQRPDHATQQTWSEFAHSPPSYSTVLDR